MGLRHGSKERNVSTVYCAELCAELLQAMGVLALDRHSNDYLPCDFSTEHPKYSIKLSDGASLQPELIIKAPWPKLDINQVQPSTVGTPQERCVTPSNKPITPSQ